MVILQSILRTALKAAVVASALCFSIVLAMVHQNMLESTAFHGWDRVVEIQSVPNPTDLKQNSPVRHSNGLAIESIKNPFDIRFAIPPQGLEELRQMSSIESINSIVYESFYIDEEKNRVRIIYVDKKFIESYRLGEASHLSEDLHITTTDPHSSKLFHKLGETIRLRYDPTGSSSASADLSDASLEFSIARNYFLPLPFMSREYANFITTPERFRRNLQRVGSRISGTPAVLIKLNAQAEVVKGSQRIQEILDRWPNPYLFPGTKMQAAPLLDSQLSDRLRIELLKSGKWIPAALIGTIALASVALIWLRFRALNFELALRRSFGQPKWQAALQALRPELISLAIATAAACLIAWVWFAVQGHPWAAPKLWPAAWGGVAIGAALALLLARAVLRKPTALLLKAQVG